MKNLKKIFLLIFLSVITSTIYGGKEFIEKVNSKSFRRNRLSFEEISNQRSRDQRSREATELSNQSRISYTNRLRQRSILEFLVNYQVNEEDVVKRSSNNQVTEETVKIDEETKERLRGLNPEAATTIIKSIENCLDGFLSLRELEITDKQLELLVPYLRGIEKFDLSWNDLMFLPLNFRLLESKIKILNLSNNQLHYFNEKFIGFTFGKNSLEVLGDFSKLEFLNLSNNNIQYIPYTFTKLDSNIVLNLQSNPLQKQKGALNFLPEKCRGLFID